MTFALDLSIFALTEPLPFGSPGFDCKAQSNLLDHTVNHVSSSFVSKMPQKIIPLV